MVTRTERNQTNDRNEASEMVFKENLILKKNVDHKAGNYFDENFQFSLDKFYNAVSIDLQKLSDDGLELEFDFKGIDFSFANALRRIMISEVALVAPEKVIMHQNTSIIQDEVLAHRLGLIPIKIDPDLLQDAPDPQNPNYDEFNSVDFELKVICHKLADGTLKHQKIYSSDLKWIPKGNQAETLKDKIEIPEKNIFLVELAVGQEINLKLVCLKGFGYDHAKFSPVSTASYKLMPYIKIKEPVVDSEAELMKSLFSKGVIGIKEINGQNVAYVENVRLENGSRNFFRHPQISSKIEVGRISEHFIFTIESVGQMSPVEIFRRALKTLIEKCDRWKAKILNGE